MTVVGTSVIVPVALLAFMKMDVLFLLESIPYKTFFSARNLVLAVPVVMVANELQPLNAL